jgi:hypothetical protein
MKKRKKTGMDERLEVRLPGDLLKELRRRAGRLNIHLSAYIRIVLTEHVRSEGNTLPHGSDLVAEAE